MELKPGVAVVEVEGVGEEVREEAEEGVGPVAGAAVRVAQAALGERRRL